MDFWIKLAEMALSAAPAAAKALTPTALKARLGDKLRRANPFHEIATNQDLLRAARLAWIEAAEKILIHAKSQADRQEYREQRQEILRFDGVIHPILDDIRHDAFNRDVMPAPTAIDAILPTLIERAPESITPKAQQGLGRDVAQAFAGTLADLSGWPAREVPGLYQQLAQQGLPVQGGAPRDFGELLFAAFAELLKSRDRYPEAREAFHLAIARMTQELGQATLAAIQGLDEKLDAALAGADGGAVLREGASRYLALLPKIADEVSATLANTEALKAGQDRMEAMLQQVLAGSGVPIAILRAILADMGEWTPTADPGEIEAKLRAKAAEFVVLRDQLNRLTTDDPEVTRLRKAAAAALDQGLFTEADAQLALAEARELSGLDDLEALARAKRLSAAETRAERAAAVKLRLNPDAYREAAGHYAGAARIAEKTDPAVAHGYAHQQGQVLIDLGTEFGVNAALLEAIDHFEARMTSAHRAAYPADWAANAVSLGNTLQTLGGRESGITRLLRAEEIYGLALQEFTREEHPQIWALIQNNLGNVFRTLGDRENSTVRYNQAIQAYRLSLLERPQKVFPTDWAGTQNNLGNALSRLGARETGIARLEEAVEAYNLALEEVSREQAPLHWAAIQINLGVALKTIGDRENSSPRLELAAKAYRCALKEYTRKRVPLDWAMTQNNLGNALSSLGERETGTARLAEAIDAYRLALEERTRDRVPLSWALTQHNMGTALHMLGERESGTARFEQARDAYRLALLERTKARVPLDWAASFSAMGEANVMIADRWGDCALAQEGLGQIEAGLGVFLESGHEHGAKYLQDRSVKAGAVVARLCGE
jgi:hypothetical protein